MTNLDCISSEELAEFIGKHKASRSLLKQALCRYASLSLLAREARLLGNIQTAVRHENQMDRIYLTLPAKDRW